MTAMLLTLMLAAPPSPCTSAIDAWEKAERTFHGAQNACTLGAGKDLIAADDAIKKQMGDGLPLTPALVRRWNDVRQKLADCADTKAALAQRTDDLYRKARTVCGFDPAEPTLTITITPSGSKVEVQP